MNVLYWCSQQNRVLHHLFPGSRYSCLKFYYLNLIWDNNLYQHLFNQTVFYPFCIICYLINALFLQSFNCTKILIFYLCFIYYFNQVILCIFLCFFLYLLVKLFCFFDFDWFLILIISSLFKNLDDLKTQVKYFIFLWFT